MEYILFLNRYLTFNSRKPTDSRSVRNPLRIRNLESRVFLWASVSFYSILRTSGVGLPLIGSLKYPRFRIRHKFWTMGRQPQCPTLSFLSFSIFLFLFSCTVTSSHSLLHILISGCQPLDTTPIHIFCISYTHDTALNNMILYTTHTVRLCVHVLLLMKLNSVFCAGN